MGAISRMQLLRGRLHEQALRVRPPWALGEQAFISQCQRCDACVKVCPSQIIRRGQGGFPEVHFGPGSCDFCGLCAQACASGALNPNINQHIPWQVTIEIGEQCLVKQQVACRSCGEVCEHGAIRFRPLLAGRSEIHVDKDLCTGCGACIALCPKQAIHSHCPPTLTSASTA